MIAQTQHFGPPVRSALCVFAACVVLLASAAIGRADDNGYSVRVWQLDDGLPNQSVTGIAQSKDGYLWVDAWGELARFDGVRFEPYDLSQISGPHSNNVHAILPSRNGGIWLQLDGSLGDIVRIKPNAAPVLLTDKLPPLHADSIAEDNDGVLWVAFHRGPICRIVGDKVET